MPTGVYDRKRKAVKETVKKQIEKKGKNSKRKSRSFIVYYTNPSTGGIEKETFRIMSWSDTINIMYERFAGVPIDEVRYV